MSPALSETALVSKRTAISLSKTKNLISAFHQSVIVSVLLSSDAMTETLESIPPISKQSTFLKHTAASISTWAHTILVTIQTMIGLSVILPQCRQSANNKGSVWQKINIWNIACYGLTKSSTFLLPALNTRCSSTANQHAIQHQLTHITEQLCSLSLTVDSYEMC